MSLPALLGGHWLLSGTACSEPLAPTAPRPLPISKPISIRPELAPNQARYDAADPRLREAGALVQRALSAGSVEEEEALWTQIIDRFGGVQADWAPDLLGRAWGNRGNARSRQGRLQEALADYDRSIELCPWSVDPVLNRGVALEALGRWDEAVADYQAVLAVAPEDPSAWNNIGNSRAGQGDWAEAARCYGRAAALAPAFSFAAANEALALYQLGQDNMAIKQMRTLLRRYPEFPDVRAALAAALWEAGLQAEAETEWQRVDDPRYRDVQWLRRDRRWPPRLVGDLQALLLIRDL